MIPKRIARERWRPVPGWERFYEVSNAGRVRSTPRKIVIRYHGAAPFVRDLPSIVLRPHVRHGYRTVNLRGAQRHTRKIGRLVALAFIRNPTNKPLINHKDGDKLNDAARNLEWSTHKENSLHSTRVLLRNIGEDIYTAKLNRAKVRLARRLRAKGKTLAAIAERLRVSVQSVWRLCWRKTWRHVQ